MTKKNNLDPNQLMSIVILTFNRAKTIPKAIYSEIFHTSTLGNNDGC